MSQSIPTPLLPPNNLSDVASAAAARANLGLGAAATHAAGDFDAAGAAATAEAAALAASCQRASNLSDLANLSTARANLGLGTAAVASAGVAGGVATLDGSGHLDAAQIPAALVGAVVYQGTWNAATNSPTLSNGGGGSTAKGNYYVVSVAGSTALDGISVWNPGDAVISDGSTWEKIDGVASEVLSFNGRTGAVLPQSGDYSASQIGLGNVTNNLQLVAANNLSDLANAAAARTNLGLGSAATQNSSAFDAAGAAAAAQSAAEATCCQTANNLSDVASAATAATNLGLGTSSSPSFANVTAGLMTGTHHESSASTTPSLIINPGSSNGAGVGATGSISGRDHVITVSLTTGTTPSMNQAILSVTFGRAFTNPPAVILIPSNGNAVNPGNFSKLPYVGSVSTTGFALQANSTALSASTAFSWTFAVVG
ncbi:MAG TPA: hypothetical protein VMF30_17990 [Pirellulales bacterium]|nr:hypothetical protein [Pirellulales bacterium]